ncbi:DUF6528 family protein [Anatilimnocola floriformis]|uniref:DUF6528 family protein n=1 Tax=Anatilimnocola floriformis TaxID=2948575 RepID=UPI0020C45AC0|nr:DUF6528 family protein [Anatilimnocola floriformis]
MNVLILLALLSITADERLIVCGGDEVFVIPADKVVLPAERIWRWRAADSTEIPAEMQRQFRTTDECKPVGESILITSSGGGVALIRRADKKCLFHASARNAHSACLLPDRRIAVGSSYGGDELLIFDQDKPGATAEPIARIPLNGAHGAIWDEKRERLWAIGGKELLLVEIAARDKSSAITIDKRFELPTPGGHDLSPCQDPRFLFVTTDTNVYRFDTQETKFSPQQELADKVHVKSVAQSAVTGRIVYHQGTEKTWWSDTIRFLNPSAELHVPDERLYKIRWDAGK